MQNPTQLTKRARCIQVLTALCESPCHAYAFSNRLPNISRSTLYNYLKDLSAQGLIELNIVETDASPLRHVYGITTKGKQHLAHEKVSFPLDLQATLEWHRHIVTYLGDLKERA